MSDWEPATEAEAAMRDALRAGEQEHYFRLLARAELVLPVDAEPLAGRAPVGWGTWTTNSRTHVLAFTSSAALETCLAEHAGTFRKVAFHELAASWPDTEWWLAVNPGLPIEGYLPAWFVAQISRGDVRLPGRTLGARARIEQATALRSHTPGATPPAPPPTDRPASRGSGLLSAGNAGRPSGGRELSRRAELLSRHGFQRPGALPNGAPASGAAPTSGVPASGAAPTSGVPTSGARTDIAASATSTPETDAPTSGAPAGASAYGALDQVGAARRVASGSVSGSALSDTPGDYTSERGYGSVHRPAADLVAPAPRHGQSDPAVRESGVPEPRVPERGAPVTGGSQEAARRTDPSPAPVVEALDFTPANRVEENLLDAAGDGSTDTFLSTLLLAKVLVPGPRDEVLAHIDQWHTEEVEGQQYLVVFTSSERLTAHLGQDTPATWIKFTQLINAWPRDTLSFAVNPGTPIGATLPGSQIVALATWAVGEGLTDEQPEPEAPAPTPEPPRRTSAPPPSIGPVVMQKTIAPAQVPYYLDRGYDRISGFVHRASEVAHLRTPIEFYNALGLNYSDSKFKPDDSEVYVLRWSAHRGNLYRIPYGGQNEAAMHAMQGWIIERSPFRGNGFAPSESRDVIAEFKVDSVRLPHGAELWRVDREGNEKLVALFDTDEPRWQRVGEQ
ncbi:MAG TPA: SseB family protein [Planosporangium sp.]|nr:SseB family protein [Planosporangium sp.]